MLRRLAVSAAAALALAGCGSERIAAPAVGEVVVAPVPEPLLQMQPESLAVVVTSTTGQPIDDPAVRWGSSDPSLAIVDANGVVLPLEAGTVRITASVGRVSGSITLVIHARWIDLALSQASNGACAIGADSLAYCWGTDVGRGGLPPAVRPALVPGGHRYESIALSGGFACAVSSDHQVYCWGNNDSGQLGDGTRTSSLTPVLVAGISSATRVAVGGQFACATTTNDQTFCWGSDDFGQLGDEVATTGAVGGLTLLTGVPAVTKLSLGILHGCALGADATVYCWGHDEWGDAGVDPNAYVVPPTKVATPLAFRDVSASTYVTCGAASGGGGVYCWGLYAGATATPQLVPGTDGFTAVAVSTVSNAHTCALGSGGAYCWGNATALGLDPSSPDVATPTLVAGSASFVRLEASTTSTCALTGEGIAYCWGAADLGDGSSQRSATPVMVADPG